jgi:YD repeat-containing protein
VRLFDYDAMGRIADISEAYPSIYGLTAVGTHYRYDLAGNPILIGYPSGRIVGQAFDGAARLTGVTFAGWGGNAYFGSLPTPSGPALATYANGITYDPMGDVSVDYLDQRVGENFYYNNRHQLYAALGLYWANVNNAPADWAFAKSPVYSPLPGWCSGARPPTMGIFGQSTTLLT